MKDMKTDLNETDYFIGKKAKVHKLNVGKPNIKTVEIKKPHF